MHTESPTQHEIQADEIISEGDVMTCPGCKREGPKSIYCNFCGYPLYMERADKAEGTKEDEIISESESDEGEKLIEARAEHPTPALQSLEEAEQEDLYGESVDSDVLSSNNFNYPVEQEFSESESEYTSTREKDSDLKELMENLTKSVSMQLWFTNLIKEGKIDEDHFSKMFEGYVSRSEHLLNCREKKINQARDTGAIEKNLAMATLKLAELEERKKIGDISDEEYQAKAPAISWDVQKFEEEISNRREEITFLEDLTNVMSMDEISEMRETAEECRDAINRAEESLKIGSDHIARVKETLDRILAFLKGSDVRNDNEKA